MKKFLSVNYSNTAFNIAMLLLRICAGTLIMARGYNKMVQFAEMKTKFMNFMGIGSTLTLSLVIFAEFFCSIFLIIGLFSRLATIPLIIAMSVALFKAHDADVFGKGQSAALFLLCFLTLLLCGPGKASVDGILK